MLQFLRIAFRNLFLAKRRSVLLGIAIMFVAVLFLLLRAASESVTTRMVDAATTLSSGHVNVAGFFKARKNSGDPIISNRSEMKALVRELVPEAVSIIDRHRGWGRLISSSSSMNSGINGIQFEDEKRFFDSLRLAPESEYRKGGRAEIVGTFENMKKPNNILLFTTQAKKLGVTVGDLVTIVVEGGGTRTNTVDLTVGAVASDVGFMSNFNVYVPRETILHLYRSSEETTGAVMIYLKDAAQSEAVMARLRKGLGERKFDVMEHDPNPFFMKFDKVFGEDWLGQKYDLTIWSDEISFIVWITSAFGLVTGFIVLILGIIIAGGIGNTMWMAVRERTKEIGTMRAIGAQKNRILFLFVSEAVLLGAISSLLASLVAVALVAIINALKVPVTNDGVRLFLMANTVEFSLRFSHIVTTVLLFSAITAFGALFPALRASRLRPVEALLHAK